MADTLWQIAPSRVTINERGLQVSNFSLSHNDQSLNINGLLSSNTTDSLQVHLNKIEVSYILSLIDLKPVSFSGKATGLARLAPNSAGNICIKANLHLPEFRFNDALMGDAHIRGDFSTADKRLHLKANINEAGVGSTMVNGYVGIGEKGLDLHVASKTQRCSSCAAICPTSSATSTGEQRATAASTAPSKKSTLREQSKPTSMPQSTP